MPRHIELANETLDASTRERALLRGRVRFEPGTADAIPALDGSVDLIWCRWVLAEHVRALDDAFSECWRVLRDGGQMLIVSMFGTHRLEPQETAWVADCGSDPQRMETAFRGAGFEVTTCIELGGEWGEYHEEMHGHGARRLIHAARLLRDPERYISQFGQAAYDIMYGDCLWHIYRMIGKLSQRLYVLTKPSA